MKDTTSVRVRIAPSPTGYPHIGTIYQALFNFAYARKHAGQFLVRIEDTDRARFVAGAEAVIFAALDWFSLSEDESPRKDGGKGPYRQSERLDIYHKYVQELLDNDTAYFAYYPKAEAGVKKDYSAKKNVPVTEKATQPSPPRSVADMPENGDWIIRMRVPQDTSVTFRDEIRGDITFESKQVTEQVLLKSDKFPTYHLAVVVDDHLMGITHIVRGEEWISSTPKHVLLYGYFGWDLPFFFHTPDLRNPDKSKLSKRQGHTNVHWYKEEGYLPEALINFLTLLGWTHPEEKEIFSLVEFIEKFDLKDIRAVGPIFDLTKLTWMNQQYIMELSLDELKKRLHAFFADDTEVKEVLASEHVERFLQLSQTRMKTLKEFKSLVTIEKDVTYSADDKKAAQAFLLLIKSIDTWEKDVILEKMKVFIKENNLKWQIVYLLITGRPQGLPLADVMEITGQETIQQRLEAIIA
ncbi:glutamate--tRNA ligase [soil metagenome]